MRKYIEIAKAKLIEIYNTKKGKAIIVVLGIFLGLTIIHFLSK